MRHIVSPIGYGWGARTKLWRRILKKIFENAERIAGNLEQMSGFSSEEEEKEEHNELLDSLRDIVCAISGYEIEFKMRANREVTDRQKTIELFKNTFFELLEETKKNLHESQAVIKEKMPEGCKVYPDELDSFVDTMVDSKNILEELEIVKESLESEAEDFIRYSDEYIRKL